MPAIQCPTCHKPIKYNPAHAGLVATCPHCESAFKVPFQKLATRTPKLTGWKAIHWAKKLMLVATILWPLSCVGSCTLITAGRLEQPTETKYVYNSRTGYMDEKTITPAGNGPMVVAVWMLLTMAYVLALFLLLVIWFALKP
jgi:hypothetical protein